MKKIIKYLLTCIEVSVLFVVVGGLTSAITKTIYADVLIENFKNKAIYNAEESTEMTKLYAIPSDETLPVKQQIGVEQYPGNAGDILITLTSELEIPFVHEFISLFAGGHAALVLGESSGLNDDLNLADTCSKAYWTRYKYPIIGLRVKMTEEERHRVIARGLALAGDPYNYSFLFNTKNKSYCSDLVAKAFASIGVNLNKDGFTTSVYDLLISGETYITYYRFIDAEGIQHIYYLDTT